MIGKEVAVLNSISSTAFPRVIKSGVFLWLKEVDESECSTDSIFIDSKEVMAYYIMPRYG